MTAACVTGWRRRQDVGADRPRQAHHGDFQATAVQPDLRRGPGGGNLVDAKRLLGSISSTAQITKAMQMVAAAKMFKAQQAALKTRPFAQLLSRIQRRATTHARDFTHPLIGARTGRQLIAEFTFSDDSGRQPNLESSSRVGIHVSAFRCIASDLRFWI
jgi:ATP synthase